MSFDMELARATYKLASDVMRVKKGESVLIVADTASDERIVRATADACTILGRKRRSCGLRLILKSPWTPLNQ